MSQHETFNFVNRAELQEKITELNLHIELAESAESVEILKTPVTVGAHQAPNGMAILPMEGCDSNPDGSPSDLVCRRYLRFTTGGAGLLWWEANAVVEEGKANPLQMVLTKENVGKFAQLIDACNSAGQKENGYIPLHILQLTHSGRYSRPHGHKPISIIPQHDPILDAKMRLPDNYPLVTDSYLDGLVEHYVNSAKLAQQAGFHGVDIKACHRYLLSELLASHTREGKYGGSFENRTRLLLDIVRAVRQELGSDFIVASRFNLFDAHPYPYGFGCDTKDMWSFDETEPLRLVKEFCNAGVDLLSNSAGNPYHVYPQVTRPFDTSSKGVPVPNEHPLESIARLFDFTRTVQAAAGNIPVVGNGYSWLRQFFPFAGAANIASGGCKFVGIGRLAFAYPEAPKDIITTGQLDPKSCCITCSKCTQIMRDHGKTGCVIKDAKVYAPLYKEAAQEAQARNATKARNAAQARGIAKQPQENTYE